MKKDERRELRTALTQLGFEHISIGSDTFGLGDYTEVWGRPEGLSFNKATIEWAPRTRDDDDV